VRTVWNLVFSFAMLAALSGCAGTDRQPECRGPWTPVNAVQDRSHG
jgi:hypothetical protein